MTYLKLISGLLSLYCLQNNSRKKREEKKAVKKNMKYEKKRKMKNLELRKGKERKTIQHYNLGHNTNNNKNQKKGRKFTRGEEEEEQPGKLSATAIFKISRGEISNNNNNKVEIFLK